MVNNQQIWQPEREFEAAHSWAVQGEAEDPIVTIFRMLQQGAQQTTILERLLVVATRCGAATSQTAPMGQKTLTTQ